MQFGGPPRPLQRSGGEGSVTRGAATEGCGSAAGKRAQVHHVVVAVVIEVKNLTTRFNNLTSVDDVSFRIEQGNSSVWRSLS